MSDATPQDGIEAQLLVDAVIANMKTNTADKVTGYAYIQATLVHCTAQALVDLLRHKGIIPEHEIKAALANAYRKRREQIGHMSIIAPPAPQVRPKDN